MKEFINTKQNAIEDLERTVQILQSIKNHCDKKMTNEEYEKTIFSKISPVYPFTNELMTLYNEKLDLKDKKVLTVTSSGDQAIISMIKQAKKIDTFDSNKLSYYHLFFKLVAMKKLSHDSFLKLYSVNSEMDLEFLKKMYEIIRKSLIKEDIKTYWDLFMKNYSHLYKYFFMDGVCTPSLYEVDYLEKEKFYETKQFIHSEVSFNLMTAYKLYHLEEKYDFINLSNIMNYDINKINYSYLVKHLIDHNLEDNGIVLATYEWKDVDKTLETMALDQAKCNPKILKLEKKYKNYDEVNSVIFCSK